MAGKTLEELDLQQQYEVTVVTLLRERRRRSIWGLQKTYREVQRVVGPETELQPEDILVLFGKTKDVQDMLEVYEEGE